MISQAHSSNRPAVTAARRRALRDDAMAIIRLEFGDQLRLGEVAFRVGASARALQRALAESGDGSFSAALRSRRMEVAAALLRDGSRQVGLVARRVGYSDTAQFTKAFRRHHGLAPRTFANGQACRLRS